MKFLVTKDLDHSKFFAYLIGSVVCSISFYLLFDMFLHFYTIGLSIEEIKTTLFGNEEIFQEPILLDSLLLQIHIDFFMTLVSLLILSSILIRLYYASSFIKVMVHTLFLSGILAPVSLLLAYSWHEIFVYIWLISFLLWHTIGMFATFMVLVKLGFK